jgi:uncharacterized protein
MRSFILGLTLALASGAAAAQTKQELTQRILAAQQPSIENVGRALAAQTSQQILELANQALTRVAPDKQEAVGKAMQADVKKFYDEIEPTLKSTAVKLAPGTVGAMLEKEFNEDELRQLLAWMESPTSRKYQQVSGELQDSLAQKLVADTRGSVEGKLKALEDGLRKRLDEAGASSNAGGDAKAAAPKAQQPAKKKQDKPQ